MTDPHDTQLLATSAMSATAPLFSQTMENLILDYPAELDLNFHTNESLSVSNMLLLSHPSIHMSSVGLSSNLTFLAMPGSNLLFMTSGDAPNNNKSYAVLMTLPSKNATTALSPEIGRVMLRMFQVTSKLYSDVLSKCRNLLTEVDFEDDDSKSAATKRIVDVLEPFHSVLRPVFEGLLSAVKLDTVTVTFLLVEVLPALEGIENKTRVSIIRSVLDDAKPSIRLAAVEALDSFGASEARSLISSLLPNEKNKLVSDFMTASLYPMQNA